MQRFYRLLLAGVVLLTACQAKDEDMLVDLRTRSTASGLALIADRGESIGVIPFDGPERYFNGKYHEPLFMTVGSFGSAVAWSVFDPIQTGRGAIIFEPMQGEVLRPEIRPSGTLYIASFNEKRDRVAYLLGSRNASLHWTSMDFSSDHKVEVREVGLEMSWSPDGRVLAYEEGGKILLHDTTAGNSKFLVTGHNPDWSPNGDWIAYRSTSGNASTVSPAGVSGKWRFEQYRPVGGIHWSPDGQFVSFSVDVKSKDRGLGILYRLLVGRVSDGAVVTVREFGANSPDVDRFRWIVDYKNFCKNCKKGLPFN